ncbi:MAG TPA: glycosyltransferase family 4 protein [Pyrinomonadaceae bacterium]|nr:glycosyltransferase family 4 protein [Pyrinomonadaceae bacterium]
MRILHISSARSIGGGERHLADLAGALIRRGHEVYAALSTRSTLQDELKSLPHANIFRLRLRNALDLGSALELARLVREHEIEVVHAHLARDYPLAALAVARARGSKLIITRHVLFSLNKLHAVTLRRVARVICVSRAVERALLAQKIFPARKLTVIPNGIDFRRFDESLYGFDRATFRRQLQIEPESLLVGTVGEIKRQKGQEDFLRAAALVARRNERAHFIIAGADNTQTGERLESLKRLAAELGIAKRLHLTGWMDQVAPLLASLDVYVSASHTESFGLTIAEAMAAGLPVVATATEGAREIIAQGGAGRLVGVGDHEALAASVLQLLEDEEERARLGALAGAQARARFGLDRMAEATEQVYLEVVGAKVGNDSDPFGVSIPF